MNTKAFKIEINNLSSISVLKFEPQHSNTKSIVISSATGVLQKYYAKFATHFASLGFTVYTFDYSGIGDSKPEHVKYNSSNLNDWGMNQAKETLTIKLYF